MMFETALFHSQCLRKLRRETITMKQQVETTASTAAQAVPLIETAHISKRFGGIVALDDAQMKCYPGETHVLIGENGAGKSTMVKIICGVTARDSGEILMNGKPIEINSAQDANRHKIAAVFQELSLIQDLSVAENIFLANEPLNKFHKINFKQMYKIAQDFLEQIGLDLNPRMMVRDLNLCQQQLVEIAKALYKNPDVLILDEATSALGEKEVQWLFAMMTKLTKEENKGILFISHRMDELEVVADRATIFRDAHYIMTFPWGELDDAEIVEHISGKKNTETALEKPKGSDQDIALEVKRASKGTCLHNLNFKLKKGEILGVAGLSGHGQVDLLHALFGDGEFDTGELLVNGNPVKIHNERQALENGIVLIPEDRKNDGLLLTRSIGENITLMSLDQLGHRGLLSSAKEKQTIADAIKRMSIKVFHADLPVGSLSGGNQQKVVIAKALATNAKIVLLSDPTRGIDIGTKNEIYRLMTDLTNEGYSILFYSTEMAELLMLCNRVMVFYEGHITSILEGDQVTEKNLITQIIGVGGKEE